MTELAGGYDDDGSRSDDSKGRAAGDSPSSAIGADRSQSLLRSPSLGWIGVTANAASGRGKSRVRVHRLVNDLRALGVRTKVAWSLDERGGLVSEASADPSCRCLVAVGGDGTVGALVNERPSVPISVLPTGTENLFARHFHLSRNPDALARTILNGRVIPLDLGVNQAGKRFALMVGLGFDAEVVTRHHLSRIGRSGVPQPTTRAAYVEPVLQSSFCYGFPTMSVEIKDVGREERLEGSTVFVFNLPSYALNLPFAPNAQGDDGWLDLIVFREPGPFQALRYLWLVIRGLHLKRPGVEHRRVKKVLISTTDRVPVQLDGDPGGYIEGGTESAWTFEVLPKAVQVIVPPLRPK